MSPPEPENPNQPADGAAKTPGDEPPAISPELARVIDSDYSPPTPGRGVAAGFAFLGFFAFIPLVVLVIRTTDGGGWWVLLLSMIVGLAFGPRLRGFMLGMWICCGVALLILLAVCGGFMR